MIAEKSMRREQREGKEIAPVLQTEAEQEDERNHRRYVNTNDDTTTDERERLKHVVESVEHEYFGGSGKGEPFEEYAKECAAACRKFSVHERGSYYTWADVSDKRGESIKVDHNDAPILARLLVERVPKCLPFIELRRCKWDAIFMERVAYVAAQEAAS